MSADFSPGTLYRQFFSRVDVGTQSFDAWMRTNRLAFRVMHHHIPEASEEAAFRFWMLDTYDGQFHLA